MASWRWCVGCWRCCFIATAGRGIRSNLILTPAYHDGGADYPVWKVINWFMAASTLVVLIVGFMRKRAQAGEEPSVVEYVRVSFAFYGAVVLAMLFYWEWIWTLNPGKRDR